jgi:tRNA nucleotidyltransferase (CCA-adding enzyme)
VIFSAPKVVPDVLWPQLKKTAMALSKKLEALDFSVFGYYHWSDGAECVILLELDRWQLPAVAKAIGPGVKFAGDVDAFVKKHASALNIHLEHERIVAVEKRKVVDAPSALKAACKKPAGLGIPGNMEKALARCKVADAGAAVKEKYRELLSDYFFAKIA